MFWSCKSNVETTPTTEVPKDEVSKLNVEFKHVLNGTDVTNKLPMVTFASVAPNNSLLVESSKFLISKVTLIRQDDSTFELPGYGFATAQSTPTDNLMQFSKVPAGSYKALRFTIGLDSGINHGNPNQWATTHPLSPSRNGMHWGWLGGYIFMVMEGTYLHSGKERTFSYHIATLNFSKTITLNSSFTIASDTTANNIKVAFNIDKMFNSSKGFLITPDNEFSHSTNDKTIVPVLVGNMGGAFEFLSFSPAKQ